jgi:hypothetical protein
MRPKASLCVGDGSEESAGRQEGFISEFDIEPRAAASSIGGRARRRPARASNISRKRSDSRIFVGPLDDGGRKVSYPSSFLI